MQLLNQILRTIQRILPESQNTIALHEPNFKGNEIKYTNECLNTGWVSSVGKFVDKFEHDLADITGAKHAIATVNGTAAVHISYFLAGVQPGDEILVPTLTFIGTINPIIYAGAIPHFIDAEKNTLGIDPDVLDDYLKDISIIKNDQCINKYTQRPIRALCVMHTLGHAVDLDPLLALCKKYHLHLIEDAAEALGSYYKNTHVGHAGLVGALSFNGNKIITTGGGGAILTNDIELAKRAKHITTTAKLPHQWDFKHDQVGYNYRLPNINAALGCAQLEKLSHFLQAKRLLAHRYHEEFAKIDGIRVIKEPVYGKSNYWLNAILLDDSVADSKDQLLELLLNNKIMARPLWNLQHTLPMYNDCPRMPVPVSENIYKRLIKIPSSVCLGEAMLEAEFSE